MQTAHNMSTNTSYIHVQYLQYQNSDVAFRSCYPSLQQNTQRLTVMSEWQRCLYHITHFDGA